MKSYPEPFASGLVFNESGEVLLVKTEKWNDLLSLPGGHVEIGESLKDAVKREINEQLGIEIKVNELVNIQEFIMPQGYYARKHMILFNFHCKAENGHVSLQYSHIKSHVWARPEDALFMNLEPYAMEALKTYLKANTSKKADFSIATEKSNIKVRF